MVLSFNSFQADQQSTVEIYSSDGTKIVEKKLSETNEKIDMRDLAKGTYFIKIYSKSKVLMSKLIR